MREYSEVEYLDAYGVMLGEQGRGINTIVEMVRIRKLNLRNNATPFYRSGELNAFGLCTW
jgi:hypothetical protein